jgi:hypothetical protein
MKWYTLSDNKKKHNEILKLIAILTMVIDHVGYLFFPQYIIFRIIGRITFPIFAYQLAKGYQHTSNKKKYMTRLWIFALISQIPYTLLFETFDLNIMFTLLLSIVLMDRLHKKEWYWILPFIMVSLIPFFAPDIISFDYGLYGILTPVAFFLFSQSKWKVLIAQIILTGLYVWSGTTMDIQWYALIGTAICLFLPPNFLKVNLNKYFFYWFYPAHLVILLIIKLYLIFVYYQ